MPEISAVSRTCTFHLMCAHTHTRSCIITVMPVVYYGAQNSVAHMIGRG